MSGQLARACVVAIGFHLTVGVTPGGCEPSDRNPPLKNVQELIEGLPDHPCWVRVNETKPPYRFIKQYSSAADHCQGITMVGDHYVIAHSMGNNLGPVGATSADYGLLFVGDGTGSSSFHRVGSSTTRGRGPFPHCGGIQSCGDIVVVAVEPRYLPEEYGGKGHYGKGSEVVFLDLSNPHQPVELPVRIERKEKLAGAAGIAYHEADKCHYVVVQYGEGVDLYKSNGLRLTDPNCDFPFPPTAIEESWPGGGTNLLYEETGRLYMAGLRTQSGSEEVILSEIENPGGSATIKHLPDRPLGKTPNDSKLASFRWGGGIVVRGGTDIDVLSVPRALYKPLQYRHANVCRWTKSPSIRLCHKGAYVAKFYVLWEEDGERKSWASDKRLTGYETTVVLPSHATNISLNGQAQTGLLGSQAWKDIMRGGKLFDLPDIRPGLHKRYTVSGIGLKPSYEVFQCSCRVNDLGEGDFSGKARLEGRVEWRFPGRSWYLEGMNFDKTTPKATYTNWEHFWDSQTDDMAFFVTKDYRNLLFNRQYAIAKTDDDFESIDAARIAKLLESPEKGKQYDPGDRKAHEMIGKIFVFKTEDGRLVKIKVSDWTQTRLDEERRHESVDIQYAIYGKR